MTKLATDIAAHRYKSHRFSAEVIAHAVWLYHRFPLSLRDVEDLLAERGIDVSFQTVSERPFRVDQLVPVSPMAVLLRAEFYVARSKPSATWADLRAEDQPYSRSWATKTWAESALIPLACRAVKALAQYEQTT
jgi:hypothetical protein